MRMRRKANLDVRMHQCGHLLVAKPDAMRGRWLSEFGAGGTKSSGLYDTQYSELHIELGCGKGTFLVESAKSEPGTLFIGLEKLDNVLVIALERAAAEGLRNVMFIHALADDLTDYFAPGEVARLYLNFCDPWPGDRHAKRRLTGRRFLDLYKRVLRPGGELHFKTDNLGLFEFSLLEFERYGFEPVDVTRNLHKGGPIGLMTDYERKFHALNMPIFRCIARNVE